MHIALLRAVNVAGHGAIAMSALKDLMAELGLKDAATLLQSGNLVFRTEGGEDAALETLLEDGMRRRLSLAADVMVRSAPEWARVIAANPFPQEAASDPGRLLVLALKVAPAAGAVQALQAVLPGPERIMGEGRNLYAVYPEGVGRSKLTTALIERKLGTKVTGRNWNTALKLAAATGLAPTAPSPPR